MLGRPLPRGSNLTLGPTWLLFSQDNVQQAGGPSPGSWPRDPVSSHFLGCLRVSGLELHRVEAGLRGGVGVWMVCRAASAPPLLGTLSDPSPNPSCLLIFLFWTLASGSSPVSPLSRLSVHPARPLCLSYSAGPASRSLPGDLALSLPLLLILLLCPSFSLCLLSLNLLSGSFRPSLSCSLVPTANPRPPVSRLVCHSFCLLCGPPE